MFIPYAGAEPPEPPRLTMEQRIVAFIRDYQAKYNRAPQNKEIDMSLSRSGKMNNRIRGTVRDLKQSGKITLIYRIND